MARYTVTLHYEDGDEHEFSLEQEGLSADGAKSIAITISPRAELPEKIVTEDHDIDINGSK